MTNNGPTPITHSSRGGFDINLPDYERELLSVLPGRMLSGLERVAQPEAIIPDALRRLFPPAYPTDMAADSAYARLVRRELLDHHREALLVLRDSTEVTHLDEEGLESWLTAITDLRLMLGSILVISEEERELNPDDPNYYEWICYHYLSYLQGAIIEVLTDVLPPAIPDDQVELPGDPWGEPLGGLRWDGTPTPEPS
jgi:hypothetical protein